MSGGYFPARGALGAATTTSWFGPVPDKGLSAIMCGFGRTDGEENLSTLTQAVNYVDQMLIYNPVQIGLAAGASVTLGSSATGPDGTSTARTVVESSTTAHHGFTGIMPTTNVFGGYKMRLSVFAKAGTRSRIALYISDGVIDPAAGLGNGCKTVFDLSGGQIGVANTAYGTGNYIAGNAEIVSFDAGWYRCTMDCLVGTHKQGFANFVAFHVLLDSGAGTAAESSKYAGDGSSGATFWRCVALPPAAWSMTGRVEFLDDFDSISTVDVNDTRAAGFNWYPHTVWPAPGFTTLKIYPAGDFSVNSSVLRIAADVANGQPQYCLGTAASLGGTDYVSSYLFNPPALVETVMYWDVDERPNALGPTLWCFAVEGLTNATPAAEPPIEIDFYEWTIGGSLPYPGLSTFYAGTGGRNCSSAFGVPAWYAGYEYNAFEQVMVGGIVYASLTGSNLGNPPASSPLFWSATAMGATDPPFTSEIDWTAPHRFSTLWLPYTPGDCGTVMTFFDGILCANHTFNQARANGHINYAPVANAAFMASNGIPQSGMIHHGDGQHFPVLLGASTNLDTFVDYVKVTK